MNRADRKQELARKRKKLFRVRNRSYQFSLPVKDAIAFEKRALTKGYQKPFVYLRKLIKSDLNGTGFVIPQNDELVTLGRGISDIGKNINQLTRYVHGNRAITFQNVRQYQQLLQQLHVLVRNSLTIPPNIISVLTVHLKRYPKDRERIISFLHDYQKNPD